MDFLDKYSASKTYDIRAIYAAYVEAGGVPLVVINGGPVNGESDWLAQLPGPQR